MPDKTFDFEVGYILDKFLDGNPHGVPATWEQAHERIKQLFRETVQQVLGEKKLNYNQTKKDHCEYCGVPEGAPCKDGCEAMDERYYNKQIDEALARLEEILK